MAISATPYFLFKSNARSPIELQSNIILPVTPDVQTEERIEPALGTYELKGRRIGKSIKPDKFENFTFKHFFPKLLKTFKTFDFSLRRDPTFRLQA